MNALNRNAIALTPIPVDTWFEATWDDFLHFCDRPEYETERIYACFIHLKRDRLSKQPYR